MYNLSHDDRSINDCFVLFKKIYEKSNACFIDFIRLPTMCKQEEQLVVLTVLGGPESKYTTVSCL